MRHQDLLFNKYDIDNVCRTLPEAAKKAADELEDTELMDGTVDEVVDRIAADHTVEVPALDHENIQKSQEEVDMDVAGDPRRLAFGPGPCLVKGTKITWRIPFEGTAEMFHCRPSTFSLCGTRGETDGNVLVIEITRTDHDAQAYKKTYEDTIKSIQSNLKTLRSDTATLTDSVRQAAFARVQQRREKRNRDRNLLDEL